MKISKTIKKQVVVIGGGVAGCAAAISVKTKTAPSLLDGTEVRRLLKEQKVNI